MSAKDWINLVILSILWGGSFFFNEVALRGLPALSLVWARVGLAAALVALALLAFGLKFPRGWALWGTLAGMGFLNNALPFTLFALAQGQVSGAWASILNATSPLWGVLLAHLLTEEKITRAKALGVALGFGGVVVMMGGAKLGDFWASLACLAAAFSYGLSAIWARRFRAFQVAPLAIAFGQLSCATLMLAPLWLVIDRPWALPLPSAQVLGAVLGLAALSTALAYLIFFRLMASAGPTNLLLVTFLIPVSAAALGAAFLGSQITGAQVAGFALIVAGLVAIDGRVWRWLRGV